MIKDIRNYLRIAEGKQAIYLRATASIPWEGRPGVRHNPGDVFKIPIGATPLGVGAAEADAQARANAYVKRGQAERIPSPYAERLLRIVPRIESLWEKGSPEDRAALNRIFNLYREVWSAGNSRLLPEAERKILAGLGGIERQITAREETEAEEEEGLLVRLAKRLQKPGLFAGLLGRVSNV